MKVWMLFRRLSLLAIPSLLVFAHRGWPQDQARPHATQERIAAELKEIEIAAKSKTDADQLGKRWVLLGYDYQDIGDAQQAESAYGRALKLLGESPSSLRSYAIALDGLASLYLETGRGAESENCLRKAVAVLERIGDQATAAIFHGRLGQNLLAGHKYKEAESELAVSLKELAKEEKAYARELVSVMLAAAYAKCFQHRCTEGLTDANRGMEIAGRMLPSDSMETVAARMTRGYLLWKAGDAAGGGESMREALRILEQKSDVTPATYAFVRSGALAQYAHYLYATHRKAEAKEVEKEIASLKGAQGHSCNGCTVNVAALSSSLR